MKYEFMKSMKMIHWANWVRNKKFSMQTNFLFLPIQQDGWLW